ncbi:MAG: ORF6N domain-containing protein [Firmicutes bacterium]|nr:ORF6N domain-containing protein [Bacillota bacterium]
MQKLSVFEVHGIRVLTTRQLADMYGTEPEIINNNFIRNKQKYVLEKHYISVAGEEMRSLKTSHQFDGELKRVSRAYFWTEKGALLHAKSLNTDKAWEVYDYLVDFYFRVKEKQPTPEKNAVVPVDVEVSKVPDGLPDKKKRSESIPDMTDPILIFRALLKVAEDRGIDVVSRPFKAYRSMLKGDTIGIRDGLTLREVDYKLAFELAHSFMHYDGGDMINSPLAKEYNTQAGRAAEMILLMLNALVNIKSKKTA